jgi:hypothetical protein
MAISLQADSTLPQGYILVDGQRAATISTTGLSATLANGLVTTSALASSAVTTEKIAPGAVVTEDLANGAVTAAKMSGGQSGGAPVYGCRAWVNFDGTKDSTGAASTANTNRLIRASGNVASVIRNGLGDYTITFTTAMPDSNYAPTCMMQSDASRELTIRSNASDIATPDNMTTTALRVQAYANSGGASPDIATICVAIFR